MSTQDSQMVDFSCTADELAEFHRRGYAGLLRIVKN